MVCSTLHDHFKARYRERLDGHAAEIFRTLAESPDSTRASSSASCASRMSTLASIAIAETSPTGPGNVLASSSLSYPHRREGPRPPVRGDRQRPTDHLVQLHRQ